MVIRYKAPLWEAFLRALCLYCYHGMSGLALQMHMKNSSSPLLAHPPYTLQTLRGGRGCLHQFSFCYSYFVEVPINILLTTFYSCWANSSVPNVSLD